MDLLMNNFVLQKIHNNKIHNVYYLLNSFFDDDDDVVEQVRFVMLHLFLMILNVWLLMMMNHDKLENEMMIKLNVMLLLIHHYLMQHDEEDDLNYYKQLKMNLHQIYLMN
jgi:uncharacterized membrane protein